MIRIIVHSQDHNHVAHVPDATVIHTYKTFDVDAPEVEAFIRNVGGEYEHRQVIGVELVDR